MILTDKCKEDFKEWFYINDGIKKSMRQFSDLTLTAFDSLPKPMQYGVYVDFFDSIGIFIDLEFMHHLNNTFMPSIMLKNGRYDCYDNCKTRQESREQAIIKANEIYNKSLNNENH